jgi:hypothetical protein
MSKYKIEFLKKVHEGSSCHKEELMSGKLCGCFYCMNTFDSNDIEDWIEEQNGFTAIRPKCGINSVLGTEYPINDSEFLSEMNKIWF